MSERLLHTDLGHLPDALVVALRGEIDLANAESIRLAIVELAAEHQPARVVLDLAGVTYMDSSGIELLFLLARAVPGTGARFVAVVPEGCPAARPLSFVALDALCPIHPVLEAALAA